MKFLLVPNLVLKRVLSLIICQCILLVFFGASFYTSTCVLNKHMDILAFYLNDYTYFSNMSYISNSWIWDPRWNPICCGPLSNVTQKEKNGCKTWNASTTILASKISRSTSNSPQIRSGTLDTCESYLTWNFKQMESVGC